MTIYVGCRGDMAGTVTRVTRVTAKFYALREGLVMNGTSPGKTIFPAIFCTLETAGASCRTSKVARRRQCPGASGADVASAVSKAV